MIQLTRAGTTLSGTLDDVWLHDTDSTATKTLHAAFSGAVDREAMTLTFPHGLGFSTNLSGTLTDDQLSLRLPQDDGTITAFTLQPGSVDSYNRLVASVSGLAADNAATAQAVADAAAQRTAADAAARQAVARRAADAAAEEQARERLDEAAKTVQNDVRALQSTVTEASNLDDFAKDIAKARDDWSAAKSDARKAAEAGSQDACTDANHARTDQYSVQSDSYRIDSDGYSLTGAIQQIESAITEAGNGFDAYRSAVLDAPGYAPANLPDQKAVQAAIDVAHSTIADLKRRRESYQSTVAKLLQQATDIADKAVEHYC